MCSRAAQVGDFGLSRVLETNSTHVSTNSYGTVAYMPAEMLKDGKMTKAVDVYSFAIIMLELFSGDMVFRGMSSSQVRGSLFSVLGVAACMRLTCPLAAMLALQSQGRRRLSCRLSPCMGDIASGCPPAAEEACGRAQVFFKVLMGYRPPVPECMPQGFKDLLLACWVRALPSLPAPDPEPQYTVCPADCDASCLSLAGAQQKHCSGAHWPRAWA